MENLTSCNSYEKFNCDHYASVARLLSVLAHPARCSMIHLMGKYEELTVGEFCIILNMKQPAVSQHLQILKKEGIFYSKRRGNYIFYSLRMRMMDTELRALLMICRHHRIN